MSKAKKPAIKKPENPRDTQFAGFAEKLVEELVNSNPANCESTDQFIAGWKQIIAQRAYDLVGHTLNDAPLTEWECEPWDIPDMTTWPEEKSK